MLIEAEGVSLPYQFRLKGYGGITTLSSRYISHRYFRNEKSGQLPLTYHNILSTQVLGCDFGRSGHFDGTVCDLLRIVSWS